MRAFAQRSYGDHAHDEAPTVAERARPDSINPPRVSNVVTNTVRDERYEGHRRNRSKPNLFASEKVNRADQRDQRNPDQFYERAKGEQPCTLNPMQSSDDARKPTGIAASNSTRLASRRARGAVSLSELAALTTFATPTTSATITSKQNGAANHHFIPSQKSIAKRISSTADMTNPKRSNHC